MLDWNQVNLAEVSKMAKDIIRISKVLHWSDKKVLRHIYFRSQAEYGCCFEFNENIALHTGFSERTVRTAKKRLLELNLIEKRKIRLHKFIKNCFILTLLGTIILSTLLRKYSIYELIKEINSLLFHGYLKGILGSNGRQNGKEAKDVEKDGIKTGSFNEKGVKKPLSENWKWVKERKREYFKKMLERGFNLPKEIINEYNL